ncbi:hypothetical protein ES703_25482 [subsurface metagenome]
MLYIDLILSFILFVMSILSLILKMFKPNIWIITLSLLFFPFAVFTYYFPDMNIVVFGSITILDILIYPFVKILIILSLLRFVAGVRKLEGRKKS